MGWQLAAVDPSDPNENHTVGMWQLGFARQLGPRFALGVTAGVGQGGGGANTTLFTLAPRARILLGRLITLDVTPGILVGNTSSRTLSFAGPASNITTMSIANDARPAFALDVSLNASDWAAVFWRMNMFRYSEITSIRQSTASGVFTESRETFSQTGSVTTQYVGVRAGSYPGMVLGLLTVVGVVIIAATQHAGN